MRSALSPFLFLVAAALFFLVSCATADLDSHSYADGEEVILWVNKVGPFRNPQETYLFFSLPYCAPDSVVENKEGLGEALQGYELIKSPIKVQFNRPQPKTTICSRELMTKEFDQFTHAVENQYWYQLFLDDLPIWGMVGEKTGADQNYIYTHQKFSISHNLDRIIEVNLTAEAPVRLDKPSKLTFSYSVEWSQSATSFENRFDKYLDDTFFEHQIHWFSVFNSLMMVIFLTGLVSVILLRTLRKDYARFTRESDDAEDGDVGDESGWKQIHGDVFRPPSHLVLFSALIGTGHQLILLVFCVLFFAMIGTYYRSRGAVVSAFIICYALTSIIAGYASGGFYSRNGGKNWIKTMLLTAGLFPGVCFSVAFVLDWIAIGYSSLSSIPIGTMIIVTLIWILICYPLTLVGTVLGKNWNGQPFVPPFRINPVPRQIPERKWYLKPWVNIVLGGILPFGSIFIEMYFVLTSVWHHKYYYVYGFMLLVYIILNIVSICVTIVSTYFLLNAEDYRWHWVSFLSSGMTAVYVYLYSIFYFYAKTSMSGFFQTAFYFGYMGMFCFGLFLLCGSMGFIGTSVFVRRIYRNIKVE